MTPPPSTEPRIIAVPPVERPVSPPRKQAARARNSDVSAPPWTRQPSHGPHHGRAPLDPTAVLKRGLTRPGPGRPADRNDRSNARGATAPLQPDKRRNGLARQRRVPARPRIPTQSSCRPSALRAPCERPRANVAIAPQTPAPDGRRPRRCPPTGRFRDDTIHPPPESCVLLASERTRRLESRVDTLPGFYTYTSRRHAAGHFLAATAAPIRPGRAAPHP